jgi:hypothetical protein
MSSNCKPTLALPEFEEHEGTLDRGIQDRNIIIALSHLQDLEKRAKATLASLKVPTVRRIRFDGVTFPSDLANKRYFWLVPEQGMYDFCSPLLARREFGVAPPLGTRRWVYIIEENVVASKAVSIVLDIRPEDALRVFEYWNNKSIMSHNSGLKLAEAIEECRAGTKRLVATPLKESKLSTILWPMELEGQVACFASKHSCPSRVHELMFSANGDGIYPPFRLEIYNLTLITRHELSVLKRRPALRNVIMCLAEMELNKWKDMLSREEWEKKVADRKLSGIDDSDSCIDYPDIQDDMSVIDDADPVEAQTVSECSNAIMMMNDGELITPDASLVN